ncbi:SMI1/KNR4 family protein [Chitinibacter sp. GC72]|uniref:SMI1/KNR4 family protein n=1 Tax=Chitinibacter sp. GC72 TaxID=1526917 RepID=UPI0018DFA86A|nr:SMI1/KNR4 family protein [Chitinibacter sp. GC72]
MLTLISTSWLNNKPFNLDEKYIQAAELALGAALPESYRLAMQKENGGSIEVSGDVWQQYPIADTSERKRLVRSCNHIIKETAFYRDCGFFPDQAVAIAGNGCGDQLVFIRTDIEDNEFSSAVYIWSHESGELELVADDFSNIKFG